METLLLYSLIPFFPFCSTIAMDITFIDVTNPTIYCLVSNLYNFISFMEVREEMKPSIHL